MKSPPFFCNSEIAEGGGGDVEIVSYRNSVCMIHKNQVKHIKSATSQL